MCASWVASAPSFPTGSQGLAGEWSGDRQLQERPSRVTRPCAQSWSKSTSCFGITLPVTSTPCTQSPLGNPCLQLLPCSLVAPGPPNHHTRPPAHSAARGGTSSDISTHTKPCTSARRADQKEPHWCHSPCWAPGGAESAAVWPQLLMGLARGGLAYPCPTAVTLGPMLRQESTESSSDDRQTLTHCPGQSRRMRGWGRVCDSRARAVSILAAASVSQAPPCQ